MRSRDLVFRGLAFYWRTNLAVIAGVATAVAVLAGALLVGDSVRGSLRHLVLQRLGRTETVVLSSGFFPEALAADLRPQAAGASLCPIAVMSGVVSAQESGKRASRVDVYGVDARFWRFHGAGERGPAARDALVSRSLAADVSVAEGASV